MTSPSLERPVSSLPAARAAPEQRALVLALGVAAFMVSLDGRAVAPLLPTIAHDFDISIAHASWLISGYMLPYGLCQLAYGPLADRFGKVRVASYAMVAFSVGTALCGAFPSFAAIVLLRVLTGAAASALIPLSLAYIGDTVPYEERQATLAMFTVSTGAAQTLSTSAGGTIAAFVSWRTVFPILGALAGASTFALFWLRDRELRLPISGAGARPGYREALGTPRMKALLALVGIEGFLYMGSFSFLSGLLEQRFALSAFYIGLVMSASGFAQLLSARLLPRLLRRFGERSLMLVGGSAMASAYLLSAVAPSALLVALACALVGVGFTLCHTTLQTRATEAFPRGRATALSLFAFSLVSSSALGTICIGHAIDAVGYTSTYLLAGLALIAFTAIVVRTLGTRVAVT